MTDRCSISARAALDDREAPSITLPEPMQRSLDRQPPIADAELLDVFSGNACTG